MKWTPGIPEVRHKGRRYWVHGPIVIRVPGRAPRYRWVFWSSHPWPFRHASITLLQVDRGAVLRAFVDWLPFDAEPAPPQ